MLPHHSPLKSSDLIPRPRVGLQESFEVRWEKMAARLRRANGGRAHPAENGMRTEIGIDRMEDAITNLAPAPEPTNPHISALYDEHSNLVNRYRVAWHDLEKAQRNLLHTIGDPIHQILQDVPPNWSLKWQHIDTSAEKERTFRNVLEGRNVGAELAKVVIALETLSRLVDAAATVTSADPAEINRRMIFCLYGRVVALEQRLATPPKSPRKRKSR
jgi:hypothetical protein